MAAKKKAAAKKKKTATKKKAAPKKPAKKAASKKKKSASKKKKAAAEHVPRVTGPGLDLTVAPNYGGQGWVVRREGNTSATAITLTKGAALKIARDYAKAAKSKVIVKDRND